MSPRWPQKAKVNLSEPVEGDTPPKAPAKPKLRRGVKVTQEMAGALVQTLNLPLAFIVPDYALTEIESKALTVALTDLAEQNAWVANLIYNLVTANRYAEAPLVVGAIIVNKLVIAKKVPEMASVASNSILEAVAARSKGGVLYQEPAPKRSHHRTKAKPGEEVVPEPPSNDGHEPEEGNVATV